MKRRIFCILSNTLEGRIAVMAVTGAIKTVLARLLVTQFAKRGDVVLMFDPKGDKDPQVRWT